VVRKKNPSLISFLYGAHWILGQSEDGMAHSHQGSIRK
jgi:hypothetical protein